MRDGRTKGAAATGGRIPQPGFTFRPEPATTRMTREGIEKENGDGAAVDSGFPDGAPPHSDQHGSKPPETFHLTSIP